MVCHLIPREYCSEIDLTLVVGNDIVNTEPRRFEVSSRALASASTVWKKLLFGTDDGEMKPPDNNWVIHLPEDNPGAMALLICLTHNRDLFLLKDGICFENLYELCVLCDKYQMTNYLGSNVFDLISPFAKQLAEQLSRNRSKIDVMKLQKALFIGWETGFRPLFMMAARKIIWDGAMVMVNDEEHLMVEQQAVPVLKPEPGDFYGWHIPFPQLFLNIDSQH
jgi:hypothetical protein